LVRLANFISDLGLSSWFARRLYPMLKLVFRLLPTLKPQSRQFVPLISKLKFQAELKRNSLQRLAFRALGISCC
jgi:hypothetical protein